MLPRRHTAGHLIATRYWSPERMDTNRNKTDTNRNKMDTNRNKIDPLW